LPCLIDTVFSWTSLGIIVMFRFFIWVYDPVISWSTQPFEITLVFHSAPLHNR
jgi:hypothetical protein